MLKLIAQLYCNDEWQWLNIRGGGGVIGINDPGLQSYKKYAIKQILKKYILCCLYINLKIECEIIAI